MFEIRGPLQTLESPVVLVAISEQADYELPEKFPWPTSYYARLIDNLNEAGAAVIGIDVIFDKYDIYDPVNDTLFAEAIKKHGNVILAGNVMREIQRATNVEVRSALDAQQLVQPNPILNVANPNRWGFVYVNRDMDGFLRRYPLETTHIDQKYQSFGIEIAKLYLSLTDEDTGFTDNGFLLGDIHIPRWDSQHFYINYAGPPSSFPEYSFSDVIDTEDFFTVSEDADFQINAFDDPDFGLLYQDIFRGKIVLVGSTMPELHDFYPTPFAPNGFMPGYESHANAVNTMLSGQFITRPGNRTTLILIAVFALVIITITYKSPLWMAVIFLGVAISGYFYSLVWMFINQNLIVEMVGPVFVAGFVVYGSSSFQLRKRAKAEEAN
jgi:adenylate cyclase